MLLANGFLGLKEYSRYRFLCLIQSHWPKAQISGCDISADAIAIAQQNSNEMKLEVNFFQKDIIQEDIDAYDIIISNPPYIAQSEKDQMHKNVLEHEPHIALFVDDADPLIFYKKIIQLANIQKATCYFETSEYYRELLDSWLRESNYIFEWQLDFQEKNRMLKVSC